MRCSECLGQMKPVRDGLQCEACGRLLEAQTDDREEGVPQLEYNMPKPRRMRPVLLVLGIVLAGCATALLVGLSAYYGRGAFAPGTPQASTVAPGPAMTEDQILARSSSGLFAGEDQTFAIVQSLQIPPGSVPMRITDAETPMLALLAGSEAGDTLPPRSPAVILSLSADGREVGKTRTYLPPAGRLKAISGERDGTFLIASAQEAGPLLQRISPSGETLWTLALPGAADPEIQILRPVSDDGALVLVRDTSDTSVMAVFAERDGSMAWSRRLSKSANSLYGAVSPFNEFLIAMRDADGLRILSLDAGGQEMWSSSHALLPASEVVSVSVDPLGAADLLTMPGPHWLRINSIGALERDTPLLTSTTPEDGTCRLWPGASALRIACLTLPGLEISEFSAEGDRMKTTELGTRNDARKLSLLPHGDMLMVRGSSNGASTDFLDVLLPAALLASDARQDTATGNESAERVVRGGAAPAPAAPTVSDPDAEAQTERDSSSLTEATGHQASGPSNSGPGQSGLACRFTCMSRASESATFPMNTTLEMSSGLPEPERTKQIEQEWRAVCEAAGGVMAENVRPDCARF